MSSKKIKKERGITLISLVITIVLLIILAAVSINVLLGEGGLINQAKLGGEQYKIEEVRDKLEVAKGEAFIDGKGTIDPDHYFDIIQEDGIIYDKETDVTDKGNSVYEIITVEGYIFKVTLIPSAEDANDMEIEYERKEEGPRIIEIKVVEQTTNSVKIEVETRKAEGAEYTYLYKKNTEGEENWIEAEKSKENEYTYNNLTAGEIYNIKVKVENGKGKTDRAINIQLGEMPKGAITFDEVEWVGDGTAKVRINTSAQGYTMQYIIVKQGESTEGLSSKNWSEIASESEIEGLYLGDTVYARLTDGINESDYASVTVEDKISPVVNVTAGGKTSNSVTVSASATDEQSGMKDSLTYTYSIKVTGQDDTSYTTPSNASNISANSYTFTGLTQGTDYTVRVEVNGDKANNVGTGILENQTTSTVPGAEGGLQTGNITASTPTWSNGEASITLSTTTGLTIQYQVNNTTEGSWQTGTNVTELQHGDVVFARLTDGNNYGDYASVNIIDEIEPNVANLTVTAVDEISITVSASGSDKETGVYSYTYQKSTTSSTSGFDSGVTHVNSANSDTYKFTGLQDGTTYYLRVIVTDKAGRTKISTAVTQATVKSNTAPTTPSVSYSSKTNTSITVTARSSDVDGDTLRYTLYAGTTSGNLNKVSGTVTKEQNQTVTISVSGLSSYTYYYWRVDVSDGKETTKGSVQSSIRTYCYTTLCTDGYTTTNGQTCSSCNGTGQKKVACTNCGGTGSIRCSGTYSKSSKPMQKAYASNRSCEWCGKTGSYNYLDFFNCSNWQCSNSETEWCYACSDSCAVNVFNNYGTYAGKRCTGSISCSTCKGNGTQSSTCSTCDGDGKVTKVTYCSHNYSASHYYCAHGNNMGESRHD